MFDLKKLKKLPKNKYEHIGNIKSVEVNPHIEEINETLRLLHAVLDGQNPKYFNKIVKELK